ncbi:MAG: hypothetical protein ACOYY3_10200 [Chloroflexota bacterium]
MGRIRLHNGSRLLVLLVPLLIYAVHTLPLRAWVVDDAGISYAYARNLAQGHGLVAQPGLPPVEGFSNFAWVLLLTPFIALRLFDPILTPKLLGMLLVGVSFFFVERTLRKTADHPRLASLVVLTLLALNTSFVAWSVSGLENPLTACLGAILLYQLTAGSKPVPAAVTALLVALTRPDGILFAAAYPLWALLTRQGWRAGLRLTAIYAAVFAASFGAFLLFRWAYFGDLVPNTYHVKGGGFAASLANLLLLTPDGFARIYEPFYSALSYFGGLLMAGLAAGLLYLSLIRALKPVLLPALLLALIALALYALMPLDWMGEFRFSTPFYVPFYVLAFGVFEGLWTRLALPARYRNLLTFATLVFILTVSAVTFGLRTVKFASQPPVDFTAIRTDYAERFDRYADLLGLRDASVLLPDLGATLYYSRLRVYDLAGLTDKTVARVLYRDQAALHDYIFETARPTFIHVHAGWSYLAGLDGDPRFRRDYVPIHEWVEPYVQERWGVDVYSGDYVRKEALQGNDSLLEALRDKK